MVKGRREYYVRYLHITFGGCFTDFVEAHNFAMSLSKKFGSSVELIANDRKENGQPIFVNKMIVLFC